MNKIFLLFFLSAILASCGNNYLSGGNEISIRMKSGARNSYHLLSVLDNSLVVVNVKNDSLVGLFSFEEVIPFDSIYKVYRKGSRSTGDYILGTASGLIIGGLCGAALSPPKAKPFPVIPPGSFYEVPQEYDYSTTNRGLAIGGIGGAAAGFVLAYIIPSNDAQLHPIYAKDREFLRQISSYPNNEPEILKLIK